MAHISKYSSPDPGDPNAAGNLTSWNGNTYEYDRFNQMARMLSGAEDWRYMHGPSDERFWSYRVGGGGSLWALRDLDGRVLREYEAHTSWSTFNDYVYRGTQLLASSHSSTGVRHFHLDHLGTPRLITDTNGTQKAYHVYYPFGEEATAFNQDAEQMKFTGHERDLASAAGAGDDLDYMHARSHSPLTGRFLTIDSGPAQVNEPQTWNRYSYVTSNPLRYIDPDGKERAQILLDTDVQELLAGKVTRTEYTARLQARGIGAIVGGVGGFGALAATADSALAAALSGAFRLHPVARGNLIEGLLAGSAGGGALPRTFPVIDRFANGIATSVKSLDLGAQTYQNAGRLGSTLKGFVDRLATFDGARLGRVAVEGRDITARVLEIVVQRSALTEMHARTIANLAA